MSGHVHPNPCPVFPCSVCGGNVTWRGRSVQCCTCSNWVLLKCSLLSFSRFKTLGSSHSWSCPPCFFWRSHTYQHCDFLFGLLQLVYLHCSIWPPLLMQHSRPILTFKLLILFPPTSYLFPLHPRHRLMLLAVSFCLLFPFLLPDSNSVLQWNAGDLRVKSTELLYFISSHPVDPIVSTNLTLTYLPLSKSLDSRLCDLIAPTSGLVFFLLMSHTLAAASSFLLGKAYSSLNFLPPLFFRLTHTLNMEGINVSLSNSFSLSFLNVYAPLFALLRRIAEPISFLPPLFLPPEISLFWRTSIVIIPSGTQNVLPTPVERKYSIGSSPLTSSP